MKKSFYQYSQRTEWMKASIIREILKISSKPGIISFAGGLPSSSSFPLVEFEQALIQALRKDGTKALQYTVTEGLFELKEYLCHWLNQQDIKAEPSQMLLTHGSQQALELLGKIFIDKGQSILVENPTYLGAIQSFNIFGPRYITARMDDKGMIPEELEKTLNKHKVKFIYTVPTFQNPSGITTTLERRKALIKIAKKKNIPILEDDPYGLLRFRGQPVPSLYSLARGKGVVYMSTFSKLLSPGIRLGFMIAENELIQKLVLAKQPTDLQTNTLIQYAVYHYCQAGNLDKHIPKIIKDYKHRCEVMMTAIKKYFPPEVTYIEPEGGMFIWCQLPKKKKASLLFKNSIKKGVAFVDGSVFYPNGGGENTFRLNFTSSSDEMIIEGIKRLGDAIREILA
ncbi:MAG: PLP-dependent aminotransferase family protein [Elusimicrobiota bacterium]